MDYTKPINNWHNQAAWAETLDSEITVRLDPLYSIDWTTTWRLPETVGGPYVYGYDGTTTAGYNITTSEMGYLFYEALGNKGYFNTSGSGPQSGLGLNNTCVFNNLHAIDYWSGTEYSPGTAWDFYLYDGYQGYHSKDGNAYAIAVRPGNLLYNPVVTTSQTYFTDYLTLGATFTFDHWWEMGIEATEFNFDVLFFNGENWETFGWELNFGGSSEQWETSTFWVPPWAQGETTRIMFSLFDGGQETDPTVYLRNIGSASAPVPEPSTIFLMGLGLVGLVGLRKKNLRAKYFLE